MHQYKISAATNLYALFGKPISHSLSPVMQTKALQKACIDAIYLAFEVEPSELKKALKGARKMGIEGINITVPHKVNALKLAKEVDYSAKSTGAANTLVPCKNGWKAYNTDVFGFIEALRLELDFTPKGKRALILGAGGAARAAITGLLEAGAKEIFITNRTFKNAKKIAESFTSETATIHAVKINEASSKIGDGDLLVSATPLGLNPEASWPWPLKKLHCGIRVFDMAYAKEKTSLEIEAIDAGLKSAGGKMMLLLQGAKAFELWTGIKPNIETMKNEIDS
jgi:shikimate dehydrogenase